MFLFVFICTSIKGPTYKRHISCLYETLNAAEKAKNRILLQILEDNLTDEDLDEKYYGDYSSLFDKLSTPLSELCLNKKKISDLNNEELYDLVIGDHKRRGLNVIPWGISIINLGDH